MSALGPKARALVNAGRSALRPAAGERDRVEEALRARLGVAVLPSKSSVAPPPPPAVAAGAAGWQMGVGAIVGAGLVGAALYLGFTPTRAESPTSLGSPSPSAVASSASMQREPLPPLEATTEAVPGTPPAAASAVRAAPPVRTRDTLSEEVALLSRATAALRDGRSADALKALDEHQSRFPRGALGEERRAARAQALCSAGRVAEGRAVLSHLAPQSPAAARARQVCATKGAAPAP